MHGAMRGAALGALLAAGIALIPSPALGQSYGGGTGVSVSTGGGGGGGFVPTSGVNPVSMSVSPVNVTSRVSAATAAPPSIPPAAIATTSEPVADVAARVVTPPAEQPRVVEVPARVVAAPPLVAEVPAVVAPPVVEEIAPRSVVASPAAPVSEVAGRVATVDPCLPTMARAGDPSAAGSISGPGSMAMVAPECPPGPGLTTARVLPRAGEGWLTGFGLWPPLAIGLVALALALVAAAWPRRRSAASVV